MAKTILEYFPKYAPDERVRALLLSAENVSLRADRERRMAELSASFPQIIDKKELYAIEGEIAAAHALSSVRILPHYPAALFTKDYMQSVLLETERVGTVSKG